MQPSNLNAPLSSEDGPPSPLEAQQPLLETAATLVGVHVTVNPISELLAKWGKQSPRPPEVLSPNSKPVEAPAKEGTLEVRPETSHVSILTAGVVYTLTSSLTILFSKHALSSFDFQCPNSLLFFHCLLAVVVVKLIQLLGLSKQPIEPLRWSIVQVWLPANLMFVGMIATGFLSLRLLGVGMFSVLKNLSNLLTIGGDYVMFGKTYSPVVWLCIALMVVSAICGGLTDLRFSVEGYAWQLINCIFTSGYALYLSLVMERVKQYTSDKQRMNELSMVYYNNLLSLGPIACLAAAFGELQLLPKQLDVMADPEFIFVAVLSGLFGCAISFSSLWFLSRSSPTIFSLTGSLNKVLVAVAGIVVFEERSSLMNLASIAVGLLAGTLFVLAKAYVPK